MKRAVARSLITIALVLMCACSADKPPQNNMDSGSNSSASSQLQSSGSDSTSASSDTDKATSLDALDLLNYDSLYNEFVLLPLSSGILSKPWNDALEIDIDTFVNYYAYYRHYNNLVSDTPIEGFPAADLEAEVQKHFAVDLLSMRASRLYDSNKGIYIGEGIGGAGIGKVVKAAENDGVLELDFEVLSAADEKTVVWGGTVSIELGNNSYLYQSCTTWRK